MAWPIPTAKTIAAKLAATMEAGLLIINPLLDQVALSRAVRSARGVFAQIFRAISLELREVHDHVSWWGRQYFVDTAEDEFVLRHADIYGVVQRPAAAAIGRVTIEAVPATVLPSGIELSSSTGVLYETTEGATVPEGGSVTVAASAIEAGTGGNLETGIRLSTVNPYPEISRVTIAVAMLGGVDEQTSAELQQAVLDHLRHPPHGGAGFDYQRWISDNWPVKAVGVVADWIGRGSVGLVVVMKNPDGTPRAPSSEEQDEMADYIGRPGTSTGVRPVGAHPVLIPGSLREVSIAVRLRPDSVITRAAVETAFARYIATIGDADDDQNASPIGAIIEPSRISEAISAAAGEYAHDLISPAARYVIEPDEYPIAGAITWVAA